MTDKPQIVTAEDLYKMQLLTGTQISPNGKYAISSLLVVDQEAEKKFSNLYLSDLESKETRPYTTGKQNDGSAKWSSSGEKIFFISNRDNEKQAQFYQIPTTGGEALKISDLTGEIGNYIITKDGKTIYLEFRKKDQAVIDREKDEKAKNLGIVYRETERIFYRMDGYGYYPHERWHLWALNIEDGTAKQLTDHAVFDEGGIFLSPDEKTLGFISNREEDPDLNPAADQICLLDLETEKMTILKTPDGDKANAAFSPDGKWISFTMQEGFGINWKNRELFILPADGSSPAISLTKEFDIDVNGSTINDNATVPGFTPIWSKDSQSIYYLVGRHGGGHLEKINISTKERKNIIKKTGVIGAVSFDDQQEKAVFLFGQAQAFPQVSLYKLDDAADNFEQITHFNEEWFNELNLGELEEMWFKGSDGNDLQGWILKPPGFDPKKKYPSILEIHGGPLTQYGNLFMHEFYYFAAKGYVVYFTNPRGGQGYGEEHAKAIADGKWGTKDYEDLMVWVDLIEKLPYIDETRMGVTGGSYGGYMTAWIIGHTDRFKAAVSQRCVSNLISMWGSSDFNWAFQRIFGDEEPYVNIETLWQNSPMKHIGGAKTPTLVIHSEQDLRCPLEQGQQLFTALKKLGVETRFVIFPDEPHGLSRMGRTDRRIVRLNEIIGWFDKYL